VGRIDAKDLPFEKGERVELVVWRGREIDRALKPSRKEIARRLASFDDMIKLLRENRPKNTPMIPDEALRREAMYGDDER
jgi:hypothetical protein